MLRAFLVAAAIAVLTTSAPAQITQSCFPGTGGVITCPCPSQPPVNLTGGCRNHGASATTGAVLNASGTPDLSDDSVFPAVFLTTSNHRPIPSGILNVFWSYKPGSATPSLGNVSGAGVRCTGIGGTYQRICVAQVFGNLTVPGPGNPTSLSNRALVGPPALPILPGETRHYFNVYRDPQAATPCGSASITTNTTNMVSMVWSN